jgi:hypothetical protein
MRFGQFQENPKNFEPFSLPQRQMIKRRMDRLGQRSKEIIMFTRTLVSGLIATTVAATMLVGTVQPSAAHSHHHDLGIGIAAGGGGFVLGSLLAQQPRTVYVDEDGGSWHVRRCFDRYASYDADSDTYVGYDGYRHYCRL